MNSASDYYVNSINCEYAENTFGLKNCSVTQRMVIKLELTFRIRFSTEMDRHALVGLLYYITSIKVSINLC
jgi:hypothetical protein